METAMFIWLASNIGHLSAWLSGVAIVIFFANGGVWFAYGLYSIDANKEDSSKFRKFNLRAVKWTIPFALFLTLVTALLPSEKTLYLMAGGYFGQQVVQSEQVGKVVKIIDIKLDEYLKEAEEKLKK